METAAQISMVLFPECVNRPVATRVESVRDKMFQWIRRTVCYDNGSSSKTERRPSKSPFEDQRYNGMADYDNNTQNDNESEVARLSHENLLYRWIILFGKKTTGGNPARDHLANERTVLAYIRTALNMVLYGLILTQLGKYVIVAPISGLEVTRSLNDEQLAVYEEITKMLEYVYRFSRPLGTLVFSMSLATLVFGGVRYLRMGLLLFSEHDVFESGLLFNLVVFVGVIPVVVIAFVYAYSL